MIFLTRSLTLHLTVKATLLLLLLLLLCYVNLLFRIYKGAWGGPQAQFRRQTFHEPNLIRIKADPNYLERPN